MMKKSEDTLLREIKAILIELYGKQPGIERYEYLQQKAKQFVQNKSALQISADESYDYSNPYEPLKGKIFAISYPDNVYCDQEYTLKTLGRTLKKYFPQIRGIHILPERTMSHGDVWPHDFFTLYPIELCIKLVDLLSEMNIIDGERNITPEYENNISTFLDKKLKELVGDFYDATRGQVQNILDRAYNSHFNDGGFSQKTRALVDPRFGTNEDLKNISEQFSTMLDYVVNHLDVDNNYLEEFRKGNNEGDAFIIIDRNKYEQLKADKILEKTFRPRPFPLFTGMRKYPLTRPDGERLKFTECALEMNRLFEANKLKPLAEPLILLLSIFFKIENDQGLTSEDKRIFTQFMDFTNNEGIDTQKFWIDSKIQSKQKIFDPAFIDTMATFLQKLGYEKKYADIFLSNSDEIFGKEFYVYTTFSESQADLNPLSYEGFKMIIDDLFHLLSAGSIRMMRMDAIKYLWKEIGKKNFDMDQGNKLIKVIRLTMELTSPSTIPLDEVNSPDPVVYAMTKEGGFAYLFGQVNTVPVAINEGDLSPLIHFNKIKEELCPENLLAFVMLSTHDGRSVQGLGVQHENGHVTFEQFQNLVKTAESRGGRIKERTVNPGEIEGETFRKVFKEAGFTSSMEKLYDLFDSDLREKEDIFKLKDQKMTESLLLDELSSRLEAKVSLLSKSPAINYFIQWIIYGKTVYEISSTSRSCFSQKDSFGKTITPEEEAQRLALGQLFVLTQGQDVPAIYFNDLLGLENDLKQYEISGKPRDLNRHKNKLEEMVNALENDTFTMIYTKKLNSLLKLRAEDNAFYPGSKQFEFYPINNQVFLNHPWNGGDHSLILGNIVNRENKMVLDTSQLKDFSLDCVKDQLTGETFTIDKGILTIEMKPFGYLWLK